MSGWTVNVYPAGERVRVVAFDGCRVLHLEKIDPADVAGIDYEAAWLKLPFLAGGRVMSAPLQVIP